MTQRKSFISKLKGFAVISFMVLFFGNCTTSSGLYYLALGDSLSVGVQPDANGENMTTDEGYADQLYQALLLIFPDLKLVKLGCPGETTVTYLEGGLCDYPEGSQDAAAVDFLLKNKGNILLVTMDIGVNDILSSDCIDQSGPVPVVDIDCLTTQLFPAVGSNLSLILSTIFSAVAGTDTVVLGMNYYNSFLALWLQGTPEAMATAVATDTLLMAFNFVVLQPVYDLMGFPVANVYAAFNSNDFTTMVPLPPFPVDVPLNVATICALTYMCVPPPVGPNIHANPDGYGVIAQTFLALFSSL